MTQVLETQQVARLASMAHGTLDYWARTRMVRPSVRGPGSGRRRPMLWSVRDAVIVRAIKALRDAGAPLQRVRRAQKVLEERWGEAIGADAVLIWDGGDLLKLGTRGELVSLVKAPGQNVIRVVALPIGDWRAEAEREAYIVDLRPARPQGRAGRGARAAS